MKQLEIAILEPFLGGSHAEWAKSYAEHSEHRVHIFGLPAQFWKWRMRMGAVTLARMFQESGLSPDAVIASDMLDLTTFLATIYSSSKSLGTEIPRFKTLAYFHENQLSYPISPKERMAKQNLRLEFGMTNITSAIVADHIAFNSAFHRMSFLQTARESLKTQHDFQELETIDLIESKSSVLAVGIETELLDLAKDDGKKLKEKLAGRGPLLLWNHRWEHDKAPQEFFEALYQLSASGVNFCLAVLGEAPDVVPRIFDEAKEKLSQHIVTWGYLDSAHEYATWLWAADILPVTSQQEFFGISVVQAMYCECLPLLPPRLSYPELVPSELHRELFYHSAKQLPARIQDLFQIPPNSLQTTLRNHTARYSWTQVSKDYDRTLNNLCR